MVSFRYAIVSKSQVVSRTNTASLIDIVEELNIESLEGAQAGPVAIPCELSFNALLETSDPAQKLGALTGHFSLEVPSGPPVKTTIDIDFQERPRCRVSILMNALPFVQDGRYVFSLEVEGVVGSWGIDVKRTVLDPTSVKSLR